MKNPGDFGLSAPAVVAIPARDEEERIGNCLTALASQSRAPDHIVLHLNNCTDRTADAARRVPFKAQTRLHILECDLPPQCANAGYARYLAMQRAAGLAGNFGVLMTTDADGRVDPDWVRHNLAALAAGADAVAGWAEIDSVEAAQIPKSLHEDDARECAYDALCDEIEALLDPDPYDPWPRHTQHSGASIAVTVDAYRRAGGIPAISAGEDRAFFAALRRSDARIRHAPDCHVLVSGRTEGRAAGGMAETIRRRMTAPDPHIDDRLEPVEDWVRRINLRLLCRDAYRRRAAPADFAQAIGLERSLVRKSLRAETFGAAWGNLEAASPLLRRRLVSVADLAAQTSLARDIRDGLAASGLEAAAA